MKWMYVLVIISVAMLAASGCTTAAEPVNPSGVPEIQIHYPEPMGSYRLATFEEQGYQIADALLDINVTAPQIKYDTLYVGYKGARHVITIPIDMNVYNAAAEKNQNYWIDLTKDSTYESVFLHVRDPSLTPLYESIIGEIDGIVAENGYTETDRFNLIIAYVRSLDYVDSNARTSKYSIQTIMDEGGDCDDFSVLMAGLLKYAGYDSAVLTYCAVEIGENFDHNVAGIKLNTSDVYTKQVEKVYDGNVAYIPIETTANWYVGRPDPEYSDVETMIYYSTGVGNPTPPNLYA